MFLTHFQIVVSKLFLVMLVLSAFHLVFIGVLWVLIEVRLSLTVDADFKNLSMLGVSSTCGYSVFYGFKRLIDASECVEIYTFDSWLETLFS
jgi:hypothetical protein